MTVDVDYSYSSASGSGNGVGISIVHESGATNNELVAFNNPGLVGTTSSILDIAVLAGDRLHFRYDNWGNAGGDIYRGNVTITSPNVIPEPSTFALAALALIGLACCRRRRRN